MDKVKFKENDHVWVKAGTTNQIGIIIDKQLIYGAWIYSIELNDGKIRKCSEKYLSSIDRKKSPYSLLSNDNIGNYFTFLCLITLDRLNIKSALSNNYYSINATKTQFYPHQLKPLIKFIDSEKGRLLISDEVGLGKTIEAGIILKELSARLSTDLKSVFIVCPSNLREKW